MPLLRYTGPVPEIVVTPVGHPSFLATSGGDAVEVPAEVAGKAPTSKSPGEGLLAQGEHTDDGGFTPYWSVESKTKSEKE